MKYFNKAILGIILLLVSGIYLLQGADESADEVTTRMVKIRKPDYTTMKEIKQGDVFVIGGMYDYVQKVLDSFKIPYTMVLNPNKIAKDEIKLDKATAVIINCIDASIFNDKFIAKIKEFVEKGGYVFTSDWALPVLTKAFPGYLEKGKETTGENEQVSITPNEEHKGHPFLNDVFTGTAAANLKWALEVQAFCVVIKNRKEVKTLIDSAELKSKYGSETIALTFSYPPVEKEEGLKIKETGEEKPEDKKPAKPQGCILHIVSHLYQQGLDNKKKENVSSMYQLIVNFLVEAKKAAKNRAAPTQKKK